MGNGTFIWKDLVQLYRLDSRWKCYNDKRLSNTDLTIESTNELFEYSMVKPVSNELFPCKRYH